MILSAVYMLWMFQRVNYGPVLNEKNRQLPDLSVRERWVIWPTVAMAIFMGIAPKFFLAPMERSVERVVSRMQTGAAAVSVRRLDDNPPPEKAQGAGLASYGPVGPRPSAKPALSRKP